MSMRLTLSAALLIPLLAAACASQPMKTAEQTTKQGVNEAAHAPFEDLNLVRSKIPIVLLQAVASSGARRLTDRVKRMDMELANSYSGTPSPFRLVRSRACAYVPRRFARACFGFAAGL